jgi:hypothetical protein
MGQQQLLPYEVQQEQANIQAKNLQNQMTQQQLDSQKNLMGLVANGSMNKYLSAEHENGFDPAGAYQYLLQKGVLPEHAAGWVNNIQGVAAKQAEITKTLGQAGEAQANIRAKTLDNLAGKFDAALTPDEFKLLQGTILRKPQDFPGLTQQELSEIHFADFEHKDALVGQIGIEKQLADIHKEKAAAATEQQNVIPADGGLSPASQQKVRQDIAVATNPQIQAGKVNVAAAEGAARANVEAQMARGSNAALAKVPPHLVNLATTAADKADQEYAQAKSVSDRLHAMMQAAKSGNVVSYQLLPEEGALQVVTNQGIHRINMAEIQNYGGGSLWQKMQGHIGKALTGASIPKSVLSDMSDIQDIMTRGSRTKYENTLKSINQRTGANFEPVQMDDLKTASGDFFSQFGGRPK